MGLVVTVWTVAYWTVGAFVLYVHTEREREREREREGEREGERERERSDDLAGHMSLWH